MKESTGHMFPDIYTTNHIFGLGPCFFSCPYCSKRRYTEEIRKHILNLQALKENLGTGKRFRHRSPKHHRRRDINCFRPHPQLSW